MDEENSESNRKTTPGEHAKYAHSPAHWAVARGDHAELRRIISCLPRPPETREVIETEPEAAEEEELVTQISAVIDRRDVPNAETPLQVAVRLGDSTAAELLMAAGADWSLQNQRGWNSLQEAVCRGRREIAALILRRQQPMAWGKWCRRLPCFLAAMNRMPDFYMEMEFKFESPIIPFLCRVAPSDTYRLWKRGADLRADMSLAGFDGFKIERCPRTFLFFGRGAAGKIPAGSLLVLNHKEKRVSDALKSLRVAPSEASVLREVEEMLGANACRHGIDVTGAELVPLRSWTKQHKAEMVGAWKAKLYEMRNVSASLVTRRPAPVCDGEPGAQQQEDDLNANCYGGLEDCLTEEEQEKFMAALDKANREYREAASRKDGRRTAVSFTNDEWRSSMGCPGAESCRISPLEEGNGKGREVGHERNQEEEKKYRRGLRPILWLTEHFPLKIEELLPLLDILADKVKAVRRLRELLTTTLPPGTYPVRVGIPVIASIKVVVTFTKFVELRKNEECRGRGKTCGAEKTTMATFCDWIKGSNAIGAAAQPARCDPCLQDDDPFLIPADYIWQATAQQTVEKQNKKPITSKQRKDENQ